MKIFKLILSFLPILILCSCDDKSPDCVCTEEFRTYLVTVVDSLGNPVDSLETTIVNDRGREYNFGEFQPQPFMPGAYYVMTDGYQDDFIRGSGKIFFTGAKNNLEVIGEYLFNTDDCHCHVYKVTGPDTLVLK